MSSSLMCFKVLLTLVLDLLSEIVRKHCYRQFEYFVSSKTFSWDKTRLIKQRDYINLFFET